MNKVCFLINTEYHLFFTLFLLDYYKSNSVEIEPTIVLHREKNATRLNQKLNFQELNCNVIAIKYSIFETCDTETSEKLKTIHSMEPDEFYFFQDRNLFAHELIQSFKNKNCKVYLCQDGFKPYAIHNLRFSPFTHYNNFVENLKLIKVGKKPNDFFSFLYCHKYSYVKGIDKLVLSFKDAYVNWNKKPIIEINPRAYVNFVEKLKLVFGWEDRLLPIKEEVIFYINQPMGDKKGTYDLHLINELKKLHPDKTIFIKNHPQIDKERIKAYEILDNVHVINSKIPAELFIAQLKDSIVMSFFSTALFFENPQCRFYYLFGLKNTGLRFLESYNLSNPTNHVKVVSDISEIR
jgi:hypothetical protein